ncbi:transcriptional regulator [Lentilactobacillus fungorum]|uniref:Transcriptional regulator n=1 Tax=Lentilactobacillus fungorum TaxID=2201250 RepID=A0ABQ3VZM8_9LACO|nr:helix-turn-helix transcriptional regulator [Lentilactobacillus fungorum]GHP14362.1 transcriptional regulator [Lentilactobacillus fungorum]
MTMVITGSLIRKARKQKGISQVQLAEGICTQATISSIETQNSCTSFEILCKVCDRLDLDVTEVTSNPQYGDKLFSLIDEAMRNLEYEKASRYIKQISFNKLTSKASRGRYSCYLGYINLYIDHDLQEAIYNFHVMLTRYSADDYTFYQAWANLGLGLAYQKLGKADRAMEFIEVSTQILTKLKSDEKQDFFAIVDLYVKIIDLYIDLQDYQRSLGLIKDIAGKLTHADLIYKLDVLAEQESKCYYAQGENVKGTMKQFTAMFIAELRGNKQLSDKILKYNQAHLIDLIKKESAKIEGLPTLIQ